jgi:hypothetical protein
MGGYVDQGCRNIKFWKDGTHLWLSCECPRDDGTCRTSQIDLNLCIGPESGGGDGLEALGGFKVVTLTYGGGKGNYNDFRDWQLVDDGRTFKCMGEVRPGLSGMLPWNWGKDSEWAWTQFNLNEHLNNVNGVLEFWAKKSECWFPDWLSNGLEALAKSIEDQDKTPLELALDEYRDSMWEEKLRSLGWEEREIEWVQGTAIKDWRIVRFGT